MYTSMWFVILTACSMYTVLQLFRQAPQTKFLDETLAKSTLHLLVNLILVLDK